MDTAARVRLGGEQIMDTLVHDINLLLGDNQVGYGTSNMVPVGVPNQR